jgi:hypothetical protein
MLGVAPLYVLVPCLAECEPGPPCGVAAFWYDGARGSAAHRLKVSITESYTHGSSDRMSCMFIAIGLKGISKYVCS